MGRRDAVVGNDPDGVHHRDERDPVRGECGLHRAVVGAGAGQRPRVDATGLDPGGHEALGRFGLQCRLLLGEQVDLGRRLAPRPPLQIVRVAALEVGVQRRLPAAEGGHRHGEAAEASLEQVVASQLLGHAGDHATPTPVTLATAIFSLS